MAGQAEGKTGMATSGQASHVSDGFDFSYTQNRELSWLQFDNRVLDEGRDDSVPLLERLKMTAIFESNLDEFFMIRVGSLSELAALKKQPIDNKSNQTPSEQLASIYKSLPPLIEKHGRTVADIEARLAQKGLTRVIWQEYNDADMTVVENYFDDVVLPIVSPQVIDPRHPFPNLRGGTLYAVFNLASTEEAGLLGLIEVPPTLPRYLVLTPPGAHAVRYTLLEDVILACAPELFGEFHTSERAVIRVTRNADIDPDEGSFDVEDDYRDHVKKILKRRLRLNPVRLEVQGSFDKGLVKSMRKSLELTDRQVFSVTTPLGMGAFAFSLEGLVSRTIAEDLCYPPFSPQPSARVEPDVPMYRQIRDHDIMLFYPYESMEPFLRLLHESAHDPEVMQIKITLYRVARKSRLCESLIAAAENGIDVTVLMELRARFDEENNIEWAERLEDAGCTVLYGAEGFKVHSKICQITRRSGGEVVRITQLGTGNYNEKTAGLYSDYSLMTADPRIGEDANKFFRNMQIGNLQGEYRTLGVAPVGLKPLIMRGLNREIAKARAGERAYVFFKMNSLTDREVIDKISEASCAGVEVNMIIRGISCLLPGVPGKTENVHVRAIVGRMLEHARVYIFGEEHDTIYLSSADMMTRNTEHRVEIAYPLLDPIIRDQVQEDMRVQWADTVKARELTPSGDFRRISEAAGAIPMNAQEYFMRRAIDETAAKERTLAERAHAASYRPIPDGSDANAVRMSESAACEQEPAATQTTTVNQNMSVEPVTPSTSSDGETVPASTSTIASGQSTVETRETTVRITESQSEVKAQVSAAASSSTPQPAKVPASVEEVVATTIIEDERAEQAALRDEKPSLELMIRQKGRASTGWALIKAGFRVLFGGNVK